MELTVVEENGVKRFDTSVAEDNMYKYLDEQDALRWALEQPRSAPHRSGLKTALERAEFELGNAERVLEILKGLSLSIAHPADFNGMYFLFTKRGSPAIIVDFIPEQWSPEQCVRFSRDFAIVPQDFKARQVRCPGCPRQRTLIGHGSGTSFETFIVCGNSVHKIPPV